MPRKTRLAVIKKSTRTNGEGAPRGNGNNLKFGAYADLSDRNIDQRSKLARALKAIENDLVNSLGGNPSPQEMILLQRVVAKVARCTLFESAAFTGQGNPADEHYLAWANSLRHDLCALGLKARPKVLPSLAEYLAERESESERAEPSKGVAPSEEAEPVQ
jgi:hypothetical protein